MIKKLACIFSALLASTVAADTNSDKGFYVGAGIGGYKTAQDFKEVENSYLKHEMHSKSVSTLAYGGMFGYKFNRYFRTDLNGQYRWVKYGTDEDSVTNLNQKIKNYSLFVNGYVDAPNYTVFTPYITAGIGYAYSNPSALSVVDTTDSDADYDAKGKKTNNFAWNAGFGTRIKLYENLDLDLGYKYLSLGKIEIDQAKTRRGTLINAASQKLRMHQVMLSLIYNF